MAEIAAVAAEQLPSVVAAAEHADHEADSPDLPPDAGRTVQHPAGCAGSGPAVCSSRQIS